MNHNTCIKVLNFMDFLLYFFLNTQTKSRYVIIIYFFYMENLKFKFYVKITFTGILMVYYYF